MSGNKEIQVEELDNRLIVYAVRSDYLSQVQETLLRLQVTPCAYIDNYPSDEPLDLDGPVMPPSEISEDWFERPVVIPLITPGHRKFVEQETRKLGFSNFCALIDPTAVLSQSISYGEGFMVNAGVLIGAQCRFGRFVQFNRSVSIGHHVEVEDYVSFGPGALLGGRCTIRSGAFIGTGAVIASETTVGRNTVVGIGAVVARDVPDNCVVLGNPARIVRKDIKGYNDVGV